MSDTNAGDSLIGYEYQFYFFLLSLLSLKKDEKAGFEVVEDVHTSSGVKLTLYQLKHTITTNSSGKTKNLTTSDTDLWKTLALWADKVNDNRLTGKLCLNDMEFVFVSNKSDNLSNKFLDKFKLFKQNKIANDLKQFLIDYKAELEKKHNHAASNANGSPPAKDVKITYLDKILSIDDEDFSIFFGNMSFELEFDDIISKIKQSIQYHRSISPNRVDSAFQRLVGHFREDFFNKTKNKQDVVYGGDDFYLQTLPIFQESRSHRLPFIDSLQTNFSPTLNSNIAKKQLADICIADEKIIEYEYKMNLAECNLMQLEINAEITHKDIKDLDNNTIHIWEPIFEQAYLEGDYSDINAHRVLNNIKMIDLDIAGQKIGYRNISIGQFIKMSSFPQIGWRHNWKELYQS